MRFLLMVVEQGTASRWCELLGRVGTHWLFLLAFCSLGDKDTGWCPGSLWQPWYDDKIIGLGTTTHKFSSQASRTF